MNENLVVIEDIDEYAYCLDIGNMENHKCPIIHGIDKVDLMTTIQQRIFMNFFIKDC
ncbi:hypothetical protein NDQ57_05895 [Rossellomorea marisflavi]|nr:hypothetical protein [Rossellomorea marisflavi]MCM2604231.1 hypothetical protein [Rossellomorea marisflavi]